MMQSLERPVSNVLTPQVLEEILSDDFVTRVLHARRTPPEQKLHIASELFELANWHLYWAADILCPHLAKADRPQLVREIRKLARYFEPGAPESSSPEATSTSQSF